MERPIGDKFDFGGITLEVVESNSCKGCIFFGGGVYCDEYNHNIVGNCGPFVRSDEKSVIFKEVEKYGKTNR